MQVEVEWACVSQGGLRVRPRSGRRFAVQGISSRTGPRVLTSLPCPTRSGHPWSPGAPPSLGPPETPPGAPCCWPWLSHLSCRSPVCRLRARRARQGHDVRSSAQCGASTPRFRPPSAPLSASLVLYLPARKPRPANTASSGWRGWVAFAGAQCSPVPPEPAGRPHLPSH